MEGLGSRERAIGDDDDTRAQVFLSYRQDDWKDTDDVPGHLVDTLRDTFPVIYDQDVEGLGRHWDEGLQRALDRAPIVLVLISRSWVDNPRLRDPDDIVRREVEYALEHRIALPVYYRMKALEQTELAAVGLEGLYYAGARSIDGTRRSEKKLQELIQAIGIRLAGGALRGRGQDAGGTVRGPRRGGFARATVLPSWRAPGDGCVGVLAGRGRLRAVRLQNGALTVESGEGDLRSSVLAATSAVVTADGRSIVVGGPALLRVVPLAHDRLGSPTAVRVDDGARVIGAWRRGDFLMVVRRTEEDGPGLLQIDHDLARPVPGSPSGATWRAAGGSPQGGWVAVRDDGMLDGEGPAVAALRAHAVDGWVDVDVATTAGPSATTLVVGRQGVHGGWATVVIDLALGAERWITSAPADGRLHLARVETVDDAVLVLGDGPELVGWRVDALPRSAQAGPVLR